MIIDERLFNKAIHSLTKVCTKLIKLKNKKLALMVENIREQFLLSIKEDKEK